MERNLYWQDGMTNAYPNSAIKLNKNDGAKPWIKDFHSIYTELVGCNIRTIKGKKYVTRVIEYDGGGEPLILIHGTGGSAESWFRNIRNLGTKHGFHVYSIDAMYHGFSSKEPVTGDRIGMQIEHLLDFMDAEGIAKANVEGDGQLWIAKFTSAQDTKPVERAEVATLKLAAMCGLRVADAKLELRNSDSPIALIRRFDRRGEIIIGDVVVPAMIEDGSMGGVKVRPVGEPAEELRSGEMIVLRFETKTPLPTDELPLIIRSIARDEEGIHLGCQPTLSSPVHYRLIADLVYSDSAQWMRFQGGRRKGIGVLAGTLIYLWWALYQTVRGIGFLMRRRREAARAAPAAPRKPA